MDTLWGPREFGNVSKLTKNITSPDNNMYRLKCLQNTTINKMSTATRGNKICTVVSETVYCSHQSSLNKNPNTAIQKHQTKTARPRGQSYSCSWGLVTWSLLDIFRGFTVMGFRGVKTDYAKIPPPPRLMVIK